MEEKDLAKLIEQYRHTGDQQMLEAVRDACRPVVEALISELAEDSADLLRAKGRDRFPFIIGKYQTAAGLSLETFLRNTYRFYFQQVLKGEA
ncbi:hypothetical protein IGX41_12060 [Bacillus velezensis]|uniref:Uncharacterized protein n=1 Tax=Bacillus velezensis TaxID=492670 RepID=A0ABC8D027_BACVE|nr:MULTISPECIES: hypothetical protein [Bacillus]AJC25204.1 hypothetical protein SB24_08440 [Bacillus sp. Pc3]ANB47244.1 hypothetical protein A1D33_007920 [Bacillus velezensis]AVI27118.1 hypothetical protein C3Z10_01395 [Bacillus velezensis]AWX70766.1 hypothetical protein BVDSYZ_01395 [Bacillus velezensis]KMO07165.1 hypothetical protein TH57_12895 [Bacillus amyloliquefaciens]